MADKMMRIAGRGNNGVAKAVKTDNSGNLGVRIVDSLMIGIGKNLFNENTITTNSVIDTTNGNSVVSEGNWYVSDFINVISGKKIAFNGLHPTTRGLAFYKDGVFVSGISNNDIINVYNNIVTIPFGVDSMRVTNNNTSKTPGNFQIEYGENSTDVEPYTTIDYMSAFNEQLELLKSLHNKYNLGVGKNLFNKNTIIRDHIVDSSGLLVKNTSAAWYVSDFINVRGDKLKFDYLPASSSTGVAFYDENKALVQFKSNDEVISNSLVIEIPSNAVLMRFSNTGKPETIQVEYGTITTEYEPFHEINYLEEISKNKIGNIMAKDINGNDMSLTSEIDNDGRAVLRVVDSAPFAYDENADAKKVKQVENIFKISTQSSNRSTSSDVVTWTIPNINNASFLNIGVTSNTSGGTYTLNVIFKGNDPYNPVASFEKTADTFIEPVHAGARAGFNVEVPVMGSGEVIIKLKSDITSEWVYATIFGRV